MLFSIFTLSALFACIEPPPSATEGGTEPGGAARPGAPTPGAEEAGPPLSDGPPQAATVPAPHDGSTMGAPTPQFEQSDLADGAKLNLVIGCDDCTGSFIVRVEDATKSPPVVSTEKTFTTTGKHTIMAPKGIKAVLMIVNDIDGNGQPTPGEAIGLWTGGLLNTDAPPDSIELTVGVVPDTPPLPPAEDDPNALMPPETNPAPTDPPPSE
jgi:hypothetical protein